MAAIAAATGSAPAPEPRPETTLAYASAGPAPQSLSRSLVPSATMTQTKDEADRRAAVGPVTNSATQASVSGRIPRDEIVDPLAGFASLPDKSAPALLSGAGTTRHQAFAWLSHPNQRQLNNVMMPGNRFVAASFERSPLRQFANRQVRWPGSRDSARAVRPLAPEAGEKKRTKKRAAVWPLFFS
ncbi:hypothetical protein QW131_20280 [Roseibium salinum]|nr:hypothetical protein [Roseibium salinum]